MEDSRADLFLVREALAAAGLTEHLHTVNDGDKAIAFIDRADEETGPGAVCPVLVLLDLSLPRKPGLEVLRHVRRSRRCSKALVIVVTSSDSQSDRLAAADLGVDAYFRKPSDYDEFMKLGELVRRTLEEGRADRSSGSG